MTKKIKLKNLIVSIVLAVVTYFLSIVTLPVFIAKAEEPAGYSNALTDLERNAEFKSSDYPANASDYKIEVLTIAESDNNELFIYTYQPAKYSKAVSISISTKTGDERDYKDYGLDYLNSNGVFYKYKVKEFTISTENERLYEISTIRCDYDSKIHKPDQNNNTTNEVAYPVGNKYVFSTKDGKLTLNVEDIEYITITDKYIGFTEFYSNNFIYEIDADVHFIAFNTDKQIDKLLDARVVYKQQKYSYSYDVSGMFPQMSESFSKVEDITVDISYKDKIKVETGFLFNKDEQVFGSIVDTETFMEDETFENCYEAGVFNVKERYNLSEETKKSIANTEWVIRFATTNRFYQVTSTTTNISYYLISNVAILQLRFETDGEIYSLGVVDNKTSGDLIADNYRELSIELNDSFRVLLMLILGLGLLILLWPFVSPIISVLFKLLLNGFVWIIKKALKVIMFVLFLPFRLLFKKRKRY